MPSVTPLLQGNSYIIIDKKSASSKRRQLIANNITSNDFIRIKFSTTEDNGLLVWNMKVEFI